MAIVSATDEQITTLRNEVIKTQRRIQELHQGSLNQEELPTDLATEIDEQIEALKAAVDAVDAAGA